MNPPIEIETNRDGTVTRIEIPLAGNGDGPRLERRARDRCGRPAAGDARPGRRRRLRRDGSAPRTRRTSTSPRRVSSPLVFGFVLLFAFGLLLVSFRSIVIAVKAIVLNLLSVAAAYGVLVAIFQWGWGENLLDFQSNGGIANWLPMFMFVILFGLSMDYHVFILSRVREAYDRGLSTDDAVTLRDQVDGRRGHQRRDRDGRRLPRLHDPAARRPEGDGHRPRGRRPDRRDARPRRAPPGLDEAARRAPTGTSRAGSSGCRGSSTALGRARRPGRGQARSRAG